MQKRVLYLTYDGLTDPLGQSQILPYLEGLSERGHRITILSFEKTKPFARLENTIQRRCKKVGLEWKPLQYTKNPPILSTIKDLQRLETEVRDLHGQEPFDLIHCRSYLTSLVALKLKREKGIPFLFDMRGFYADERVDGKIWNLTNPLYKRIYDYFKIKERDFLEQADAIVSLTYEGKREIENWYVQNELYGGGEFMYNYDRALKVQDKITIIPCASDLDHFDFRRITDNKKLWLQAVYGIDPSLEYLGYVGSLGTWYMANEMLDLYKVLLQKKPSLRFLILSHDDLAPLRQRASSLGIPQSYIVHVAAERKDVPALMSLMSASVFFILPAYSKKASSPTKQGELMAMGIPVICNAGVGDSADIVEKFGSGWVVKNCEEEYYIEVAENWDKITLLDKIQIRIGAKDYFSLEKGINAYGDIYCRIE
ncbi:glycosyltransferase [Cryomorphaceae bacterium 1068]|nr:glycosyltransferase [Cryomorphaceae bacterium 1068]